MNTQQVHPGPTAIDELVEWLREKIARGVKQVWAGSLLERAETAQREHDSVRLRVADLERRPAPRAVQAPRRQVPLDLVGTKEASEILEVEPTRIHKWRNAGVLPEPIAQLASGPVWHRHQIEGALVERNARRRRRGGAAERAPAA